MSTITLHCQLTDDNRVVDADASLTPAAYAELVADMQAGRINHARYRLMLNRWLHFTAVDGVRYCVVTMTPEHLGIH